MSGTNPTIDPIIDELRGVFTSFLVFLGYCWIEGKSEGEAVRFDLWPDQQGILDRIINSLHLIVIKARQLGLTWLIACYCLWVALTRRLQLIVIMSSKDETAVEFLDRIKFVMARLPLQRWGFVITRSTTHEIEVEHVDRRTGEHLNSVIKSLPTTEAGAQSKTPTILVIDEAHESGDVAALYAASKPGIDAAHGQVVVIANTVKNRPGWPWVRGIYQGAIAHTNDFARIFLPWWSHPERSREPINDPVYGTLPRFRVEQLRGGMTEDDFGFHYPESETEALSTLGGSYFGKALTRHPAPDRRGETGILQFPTERDLLPTWIPDAPGQPASILTIWHPPYWLAQDYVPGHYWTSRYCLGVDVSEGLGQSYSVAYVLDRLTDELVCRLRDNRIAAHDLVPWVYWLSQWYRNALYASAETGLVYWDNALIAVERTGAGQTTVGLLEEIGATQYQRQVVGKLGDHITTQLGWHESQQAKYDLSEALRNWLATTKGRIHCPILLDEAGTWIQQQGSKKLGPEEGHYGDCVMAAGCTLQASLSMGEAPKEIIVSGALSASDKRLIRLSKRHSEEDDYDHDGYFERRQERMTGPEYDGFDDFDDEDGAYEVEYVSLGKQAWRSN